MPPYTTIPKLLKAISTGRSKTTDALEDLFKTQRQALASHLRRTGSLNGLKPWLQTALAPYALTAGELKHIQDWPDGEKEKVRQALVTALDTPGAKVHFRWGTHPLATENSSILQAPGLTTIKFLSPNNRVRTPPPGPQNHVHVDVGRQNDGHPIT